MGNQRGHSQWTIAVVTAVIGLGGAFGGALVGGQAASTAATNQIEAANAERYRESRAEAYMELIDVLVDLRSSWTSWSRIYPATTPDESYTQTYLVPVNRELTANINNFTKAVTRIEAFGSARATVLAEDMRSCVNRLADQGRGYGTWGGPKPPTADELEAHSSCLFNGAVELAKIAEQELSPKENPDLSVSPE